MDLEASERAGRASNWAKSLEGSECSVVPSCSVVLCTPDAVRILECVESSDGVELPKVGAISGCVGAVELAISWCVGAVELSEAGGGALFMHNHKNKKKV